MLAGLSAFPLTPFVADGTVDEPAFVRLVERLVGAGVDSIGALGSTGSYAYLRPADRARLTRLAVDHAGDVPVMVSVGATATRDVLEHIDAAQAAGAAAVLLAPVSYQPLTADEVYALFEDADAALSIPLTVYDNPRTTQFHFTDDLYEAIAQLPHVKSIKISGVPAAQADADARIARLRERLPKDVSIGVSGDASAVTGFRAGCDVWYSVIGGTLPGPALTITRAIQAGDTETAVAESNRLQPLFDLFAQHGGSLRVMAAVAECLGLVGPSPLPRPIRGLSAADRSDVVKVINLLGFHTGRI